MVENQIDIPALNETFPIHIQKRQTSRHQRWHSHPGEKGIIVNQEWKNEHFNFITDNEALAIELELQNGDKVILAII